jgi:hypothetical protein
MADIHDYELLKADGADDRGPQRSPVLLWIGALVLLIAMGVAAYIVYHRRPVTAPSSAARPVETQSPARPLGGEADNITVPPLGESDPLVRDLVRKLTTHPRVLAWLATNGLIRNFVVSVQNVAEGTTPATHLRALAPALPFKTVERGGELFVDSRSYERYDGLAAAAASIDPAGAARLYSTLKPRIEEAYGELGVQPPTFDRALERAIVSLLRTPVVDGPVRVEPKGIGYGFADPALEGLTSAQKQLLRMGPRNERIIQSALRQIALALGIPIERLPVQR